MEGLLGNKVAQAQVHKTPLPVLPQFLKGKISAEMGWCDPRPSRTSMDAYKNPITSCPKKPISYKHVKLKRLAGGK